MRIYIEGLEIPFTNEWWVDETWTVQKLKISVIKIFTSKKGSTKNFDILYGGVKANARDKLVDIMSEGESITILKKEN